LAAGLGILKTITSPTFVLMKIYKTNKHESKTNLYKSQIQWLCHIDAYRLKSGQDLIDIGLKDWLNQPNTIVVIEWANQVKDILPKNAIIVKIKLGQKQNQRIFQID
jgi:tRNA threonylcarbamoyladenosine biosynthesis protein TsaE